MSPDDPEPLAWISLPKRSPRFHLPGLRYPVGSLIYGCILIALGVVTAIAGLAENGTGRAMLLLIALIPAGLGVWMVVIAATRWGWYRRYVQRHGHPPF